MSCSPTFERVGGGMGTASSERISVPMDALRPSNVESWSGQDLDAIGERRMRSEWS